MHRQRGFTLIELLLAMVIIGILAAIAIPAYQGYVERSYRADAQAELLEIAQRLERRYSQTFSYANAGGSASSAVQVGRVPEGGDARYLIILTMANSGSSYTLNAAPQGTQQSDECGTLTLNQNGSRSAGIVEEDAEGERVVVTVNECW
ncbi:type IV pilus assembly protein PilE [Modicisalibacter muralis]|uniref:Type IV pilus assembly protein PilE n=1 Tax=Modicisalibacter muralis TaxID=119000 RepID=A0A1G9QKR8_9GAMM|nr:type IV pilin protein [Halomonas muralis]SDM11592.1 type IV pilus assembly protein PilE [Halomonas muralis]